MRKNSSFKIENLEKLKFNSKFFTVPDFFFLTFKDWNCNKKKISNYIKSKIKLKKKFVAIRSCFSSEDGNKSFAGVFKTFLNINLDSNKQINNSINEVFKSYLKYQNNINHDDGLIIQEMIKDTSMSGVVFTHELNSGSPYLVINYDDESGETNTVTSGIGKYSNRTLYIYRNKIKSLKSKRFITLVRAVSSIEKIFKNKYLDIEFAMDYNNKVYIFQTRKQINIKKWTYKKKYQFNKILRSATNKYLKIIKSYKSKNIIFGQMPDWNPAEILGNFPNKLSSSLYKYLITDNIWALARKSMGYKYVKDKLMEIFCGRPYINTYNSFNSFIPRSVDKNISEKLINFWSKKLSQNPHLHDKIEFDIAITFFDFTLQKKLNSPEMSFLSRSEKKTLFQAYEKQMKFTFSDEGIKKFNRNIDNISILDAIQKKNSYYKLKINKLLTNCKKYGTFNFAIFARYGFISKILLDSLTKLKIISQKDNLKFLFSISTCATQLVDDFNNIQNGKIKKSFFLEKYGFLRPGSYDINSRKYSEMKDLFFKKNSLKAKKKINKEFSFKKINIIKINSILNNLSINKDVIKNFCIYLKKFIFYREESKFIFSKSLSRILDLIIQIFKNKLNSDEIGHLSLNQILKYQRKNINLAILKKKIKENKKFYELAKNVKLPQVILDKNSFYVIPFQVSKPNFIVKKKITCDLFFLDNKNKNADINSKIVLIENADPGFDWIFTRQIKGLITKYGGANSHMAIRSAEFNIPCAIGCGEQQFERLREYKNITIDGKSETITMNY